MVWESTTTEQLRMLYFKEDNAVVARKRNLKK